jgi:hypothetical protein
MLKRRGIVLLAGTIASVSFTGRQAMAQRIGMSPESRVPAIAVGFRNFQTAEDCKRSRVEVLGQLMTGVLGVWIGGLGAYIVVDRLDKSGREVKGDAGYSPNANTAYAIGSWAGSTVLTYLGGPRGCGSLGRTAIGTGIPSAFLLLGRHEPYLPLLGVVLYAPLQAAGGTLMFPK